jgi:hypothetical protein
MLTFPQNVERSAPEGSFSRRFMASQYFAGLALSARTPTISTTEKSGWSSTHALRIWFDPQTTILPCESGGISRAILAPEKNLSVQADYNRYRTFIQNLFAQSTRAHRDLLSSHACMIPVRIKLTAIAARSTITSLLTARIAFAPSNRDNLLA